MHTCESQLSDQQSDYVDPPCVPNGEDIHTLLHG